MVSHNENILRIKAVDGLLEELRHEVVYVGGATVSLYADRVGHDFRPTNDIDILVEVASTGDYLAVQEKLRNKGFEPDSTAQFVGRFTTQGLIVDLMPTLPDVLGFSNRWYSEGFKHAMSFRIDDEHTVRIFTAPHFIATKFEAYHNRGKGDGRTSSDFEDIIYVLENRRSIWDEMRAAPKELKSYLTEQFAALARNPYLEEWIDGHTGFNSPPATYYLVDQWQQFAGAT